MNDTRPYQGYSDKLFPHTLPDGRTGYYKGDWYRGIPHGRGTFVFITKNWEKKYVGDFDQGDFNGRGVLYAFSKTDDDDWKTYDGGFQGGDEHGWGTLTFSDGSTYEGQMQRGIKQGQGTYTTTENGRSFSGIWDNGKLNGKDVNDLDREAEHLARKDKKDDEELKKMWKIISEGQLEPLTLDQVQEMSKNGNIQIRNLL